MSPQFVDLDADGNLDIVAGTFDGSPHVAFGTGKSWQPPEHILDKNGQRIVLNQYWNPDASQWDTTSRCDPRGHSLQSGHATSAWAVDWDADGDLDLLLGDHNGGYVYLRINEGTATRRRFATTNLPLYAGVKALQVPQLATIRPVDWNHDGLVDLVCSSLGDAGDDEGGAVYLFLNRGTKTKAQFQLPQALVPKVRKSTLEPIRPDTCLYADVFDHDGDGDLDLLVGGHSLWKSKPPTLTPEQRARARVLETEVDTLTRRAEVLRDSIFAAKLARASGKRAEQIRQQEAERAELGQKLLAAKAELDLLVPAPKRVAAVWLYENRTTGPAR